MPIGAYRPQHARLLVELCDLYNGQNNGEVFLSHRDAARRLGVGKNLAGKAFRELEDRGFIRVQQLGSFHQMVRHATQWVLTEFPHGGHLPTKDVYALEAGARGEPRQRVSNCVRESPPCPVTERQVWKVRTEIR